MASRWVGKMVGKKVELTVDTRVEMTEVQMVEKMAAD